MRRPRTVAAAATPGRRAPFKLRKFYRANPGRKPCPVYDPADVDRLKRALAAQAIAPTHSHATARVPTNERNGHGGSDAALVVATIRQMSLDIQGIITGALDRFERLIVAHKEAVPLSEKMLVTPEEAGQLADAGQRLVRGDAAAFDDMLQLLGQLPADRDGAVLVYL